MKSLNVPDLEHLLHEGAIRLEITGGVPTWEAFPGVLHQETIDLIRASIEPISAAVQAVAGGWGVG